ncbi:DUF551 domain-containing protein [Enterobacter hormaechei]|uniref:DUF551 domain-containing protein n=1 Tax=Enterobacter hormaechei TaxID=158836 RepID=UPI00301CC237
MSTFTKEQLPDDRLVKILTETQAVVTEHNSRCVRGSVEVDARLFESMLVEIQLRRHLMEKQAAMLQGAENAESPTTMQTAPELDYSPKNAESPTGINQGKSEPVTTAYKLPFEQWLSQQTGTIDVECGCVMTEVFFHWLRVAYEAGNSPVTPGGWVACSERMPVDFETVLVCQDGGVIFCAEYEDGDFYPDEFPNVPKQGCEITHWMPLPAAPQQEVK